MKPVSNTMNDAPSREPESIVNVWSFVSVPAPKRVIAVAATGEPESTKYAPSQPNPNVEMPFANGNSPWICGPIAAAPAFMIWTARMNRYIAGMKSRNLWTMYQPLRGGSNGPQSTTCLASLSSCGMQYSPSISTSFSSSISSRLFVTGSSGRVGVERPR